MRSLGSTSLPPATGTGLAVSVEKSCGQWRDSTAKVFMNRRGFLQLIGATGVAALTSSCSRINSVVGTLSSPTNLVRFPEKTEMILLTDRPPQLETPLHYFRQDLTPNEAFFVRWHLEGVPTSVDLRTFRLNVSGHVRQPLQLSVEELRSQFEPSSIIAVNQCSGNSRSFFEPRVPGGQWKHVCASPNRKAAFCANCSLVFPPSPSASSSR